MFIQNIKDLHSLPTRVSYGVFFLIRGLIYDLLSEVPRCLHHDAIDNRFKMRPTCDNCAAIGLETFIQRFTFAIE